MIYKSGKVGYYKSYEYAKTILNKMKNIISFKVFGHEKHNYYEVINNHRSYYNLILIDEDLNEYWFDTGCGDNGIKSFYSEKILNLVGIREDYNLGTEKELYEFNLFPNNKLNLLVVEIDLSNSIEKYFISSLISLNFENAYYRYISLDKLKIFGAIKSVEDTIGDELYTKYFDDYKVKDNDYKNNSINNILFLDSYLNKDIKSNISNNINNLLESKSYIYIKEIKKIEYGIYVY